MTDITEQEIVVFVEAVIHYFFQITGEKPEIESSFLAESSNLPVYDFTGKICVSGKYEGNIYFSATKLILTRLLLEMKEFHQTEAHWLDAVGEIANTLAGNARKYFGETMGISVPTAFQGQDGVNQLQMAIRKRPYVINLKWKKFRASVIVDMIHK